MLALLDTALVSNIARTKRESPHLATQLFILESMLSQKSTEGDL